MQLKFYDVYVYKQFIDKHTTLNIYTADMSVLLQFIFGNKWQIRQ